MRFGDQVKEVTPMQESDVLEFCLSMENSGITVWIDGGWGVDALLGEQTRPHKDLDIAIQGKDVALLREELRAKGYHDIRLEIARPHNFVLGDGNGHEVDVHVIVLDAQGNGIYGPPGNGEMYPAASLNGMGTIAGHPVKCISPAWAIKFHSGYRLQEKDFKDVSALCEKFGVKLPEEYTKGFGT